MKKIDPGARALRSIHLGLSLSVLPLAILILAVPTVVNSDGRWTFTTIDFPGANISTAWAINSAGEIIGTYTYGDHQPEIGRTVDEPAYGFLLDRGTFILIQLPGVFHTLPYAISNNGTIVGAFTERTIDNRSGTIHCFQLRNGNLTLCDFPGARSSSAWGINSAGDVVGRYVAADGTAHGFLPHDGEYTSI